MIYDAAVIGAGAMGSAALWRCSMRGAKVIGFEQFYPGNDKGSSYGESRMIHAVSFADPYYTPFVLQSMHIWRELEDVCGLSLVRSNGALITATADSVFLQKTEQSAQEHQVPYTLLTSVEHNTKYPQRIVRDNEITLYEKNAGFALPEACIVNMAEQALLHGADIRSGAKVTNIAWKTDTAVISAEHTEFKARRVIFCAGAWTKWLIPDLHLPLEVERQVQFWTLPCRAEDAEPGGDFAPEQFPVFLHEYAPDSLMFGYPSLDSRTIKLVARQTGQITHPDMLDRIAHQEDAEVVTAYINTFLPGLIPEPLNAKVCMYTNTPDKRFILGAPNAYPTAILLAGFSGLGFKFAPIFGDIAADLALTGATAWDISQFSPDRFQENN